jgi:phosphatidate cytidylyltransferase
MSNFYLRTLSGAVYVALVIGCIWLHPYLFGLLLLIFSIISQAEFYQFKKFSFGQAFYLSSFSAAFILFCGLAIAMFHRYENSFWFLSLPLAFIILYVGILVVEKLPAWALWYSIKGILYTSVPLACLFGMYFIHQPTLYQGAKEWQVLSVFLLIWVNDTFAYLSGRTFGKHKMAPLVSPKKTWEGFAGGAIAAALVGVYLLPKVTLWDSSLSVAIALICVVAGTLGDLFESYLKRKAGVKDSGTLMPGHGGILDRLDSVIFAAPAVYLFLFIRLKFFV